MAHSHPHVRDPDRTGGGAIDRSVLGEWLAGDDAAIDAMLAIFRESAQSEMAKLRDARTRGDVAEFIRTAHRLRGGALSMGARDLARALTALENAGKARNSVACGEEMAEVEARMDLMTASVHMPGD